MDEPFVGLDPKAAHTLKLMMRELCDNCGAIFFSTHVLEVAEKLCDKVAIIKGGKLIRSGTMEEVKGDDSLEDVFLELEK
jgi:ABC-2 type transport system ATP-binding protein